jgi:hypothetical protein
MTRHTGKRRITHWRGADDAVAWLPDGRLVLAHFREDEPLLHWCLIRPDGKRLRALPHLYGAGFPLDWLAPR